MAGQVGNIWREEIAPHLALPLRRLLERVPPELLDQAVELRLRSQGPLQLVLGDTDTFLDAAGRGVADGQHAFQVPPQLLADCWQIACRGSVYAWEDETRQGFLTLPGGHRLGLAGTFSAEDGRVTRLQKVSSLAVRLSRPVIGCADTLLPRLLDSDAATLHHTLIYSAPGAGKTTLLRDLVRQVSQGRPSIGLPGRRVAVIDERSEIAASRDGLPQHELGPRTDVLDGCPKAVGIMMALRSLNPEIIACDEIAEAEEAPAVMAAVFAGVRVITTAHGSHWSTLQRRPALRELAGKGVFTRFVRLERRRHPGYIAAVEGAQGRHVV